MIESMVKRGKECVAAMDVYVTLTRKTTQPDFFCACPCLCLMMIVKSDYIGIVAFFLFSKFVI